MLFALTVCGEAHGQSEFHHKEVRTYLVGNDTDATFAECVEFIEFLPQYVVDELAYLFPLSAENPVTIRRYTPSTARGDPFEALGYWFEPTDKVNEEYTVATSCVRFPEFFDGPDGGVIFYRVVYSYFATSKGAFERTNAAGYYINNIVTREVGFEEIEWLR